MKTVFPNISMVCHVWAQRSQPFGKTGNGNVYFDGSTIYSYGWHFPIAKLIDNKQGETVCLYNDDSYSVSTSNHQNEVRSAASHYRRITCDTETLRYVVNHYHNTESKEFRQRLAKFVSDNVTGKITESAKSAARRRAAHLKQRDIDSANRAYSNGVDLLDFYGAKMPIKTRNLITKLNEDTATVLQAHEKQIAAQRKKEAKLRAEREKERQALIAEAVQVWLEGGEPTYKQGDALRHHEYIYMRPEDDGNIHTTHKAQFPIEHGKKAFAFIRQCKERGETWHKNGQQIRLGHFAIDSIDAKGNVKAGCHYVKWDEIERVARILEIYP